MIPIIINEWQGYPVCRTKKIKDQYIQCGIYRLLKNLKKNDAGIVFEVILVINSCSSINYLAFKLGVSLPWKNTNNYTFYKNLKLEFPFIKDIIFHNNKGADIGGYNKAYNFLKNKNYREDVVFMNSSVRGPLRENWLKYYKELFNRNEQMGITGISINSYNTKKNPWVFDPHVQTFFMYTNMLKLIDVFGDNISGYDQINRIDLIEKGEIEISRKFLNRGYGINCKLLDEIDYFKDSDHILPRGDLRNLEEYKSLANLI